MIRKDNTVQINTDEFHRLEYSLKLNLRLINGRCKDLEIYKVDEFINERFLGKTHIETMEIVEGR